MCKENTCWAEACLSGIELLRTEAANSKQVHFSDNCKNQNMNSLQIIPPHYSNQRNADEETVKYRRIYEIVLSIFFSDVAINGNIFHL